MKFDRLILRKIIEEQREAFLSKPLGIIRDFLSDIDKKIKIPHIIAIVGIRRCGKSTLLRQIVHKYYADKHFYYVNFDDNRLIGFNVQDFDLLNEVLIELYGEDNAYFFDEIQNIEHFDGILRRLHEERKKVYITGSNASILREDISTKLTGRNLIIHLFPFSFREFLFLKDSMERSETPYSGIMDKNVLTTNKRARLMGAFEEFLRKGGMPEYLLYDDEEILRHLFNDILIRDITARYGIRNFSQLNDLCLYLFSNIGRPLNYSKIAKLLKIKSTTSVRNYVDYIQNAFLGFIIPKMHPGIKQQLISEKKFYGIDQGIIRMLSLATSDNLGWLLENIVFLELRRRYPMYSINYVRNSAECDFVVRNGPRIITAIQVTYILNDENREREINGLKTVLDFYGLKEGVLLTYDYEEIIMVDNKTISVIPLWKWLLGMGSR